MAEAECIADCGTETKEADAQNLQDVKLTSDGKNVCEIKCQRCPSVVIAPQIAKLVTHKFCLPQSRQLKSGETVSKDKSAKENSSEDCKYWCVEDMYHFENIGFTKSVDDVKYLICADCEIGPIGWFDKTTNLSYVALDKVKCH